MLGEDLDPGCQQTLEPLAYPGDLRDLSSLWSASAGWASGASLRHGVPPSRVEALVRTDVLSALPPNSATARGSRAGLPLTILLARSNYRACRRPRLPPQWRSVTPWKKKS